jgi:hypothetical protein
VLADWELCVPSSTCTLRSDSPTTELSEDKVAVIPLYLKNPVLQGPARSTHPLKILQKSLKLGLIES